MEAILYLARTGCQWRLLPKVFAPWPVAVYRIRLVTQRRHRVEEPRRAADQGPRG
ncbi:transposase [Streptomyces sp. So13.3]|nr:transposase [Streptomyces sp. So13.3]